MRASAVQIKLLKMENSEEKKPDSKQKKIFEMFTRVTPKTKSVVVPSNPESTIDLTSRSPPSSGSSSRHGKNVFTKMIDIKKVNGKEPLLLEALESMLEKSDEDEPKKKTRPGPKFSKERSRKSHHKKSNESLQAEGESPANNTKSSELSAQSQDIMDSSQSSHQGDDQNLLMPLDNVRQRKRRLSPGSPVAPRNTRHNSKNESEKQNEISVKIEKNQDVPENTQMEGWYLNLKFVKIIKMYFNQTFIFICRN